MAAGDPAQVGRQARCVGSRRNLATRPNPGLGLAQTGQAPQLLALGGNFQSLDGLVVGAALGAVAPGAPPRAQRRNHLAPPERAGVHRQPRAPLGQRLAPLRQPGGKKRQIDIDGVFILSPDAGFGHRGMAVPRAGKTPQAGDRRAVSIRGLAVVLRGVHARYAPRRGLSYATCAGAGRGGGCCESASASPLPGQFRGGSGI